jgi:hypothetical protein
VCGGAHGLRAGREVIESKHSTDDESMNPLLTLLLTILLRVSAWDISIHPGR